MELTLLQRAEEAERATEADEFRIISEAALAIFGWQDERYKRVLRMLEAGASLDAALTIYVRVPERVPSNPRLAAAEALRRRAGIEHV